jgi:hypothetical protein
MSVYKVAPNGLAVAFRARGKATKAAIVKGLQMGALAGKVILIRRTPVDEGVMRASWAVIMQPWGAQLVSTAPHAGIVEGGSRPHWPNMTALREWVVRHRKAFGVKKGRSKKAQKSAEADIDRITYLIARKIARFGTKPRWVVRGALPQLGRLAKRAVDLEIRRHA